MCDVVCGPVEEGSEAERLGVKEGDGIAAVNGNRSVKSIGAIELLAATPPFVVTLLRMRGGGGEDTNQEARSGNKGGKNGGAGGEASGLISSAATEGGEGTMDAMRDVSASRGPPVAVVRQSSVLVDVSVGFGMETSDSNDPMMGGARITRIIYEDGVKLQAEQLGLQCDDCIYEIGGERVKSNKDFARLLRAAAEKAAAEDDKEGEHEEEDEGRGKERSGKGKRKRGGGGRKNSAEVTVMVRRLVPLNALPCYDPDWRPLPETFRLVATVGEGLDKQVSQRAE
jgi:hypothetical protein